jgi:hypothetical protein
VGRENAFGKIAKRMGGEVAVMDRNVRSFTLQALYSRSRHFPA